MAVSKRACDFDCRHVRVEPYMQQHPDGNGEVRDIEELVKLGQGRGPCPYYLSRCAGAHMHMSCLSCHHLVKGWAPASVQTGPHAVEKGCLVCVLLLSLAFAGRWLRRPTLCSARTAT